MKKTAIVLTIFLLVAALMPTLSAAALPLRVVVNGERVLFPDAVPFVDSNARVQVPLRFVSEALGAKVGWTNKTRVATVEVGARKIVLTVGKKEFRLNGKTQLMDTAAMLKSTRTFVPVRFVTQALGASINWDKIVNTIYIDTTGIGQPANPDSKSDEEVIHGFTVKYNTGSQLIIDKGPYDELGKRYAIFGMRIVFDKIGADLEMQFKEVEEVLRQKVESATVDSIMQYVKKKTKREYDLPSKEFSDENYRIFVASREFEIDTGVTIFLK